MSPEIIFLAAVMSIAGLHSLFSLVKYLAGFKRTNVREDRKEKTRDDWYVFFETSALYGDLTNTAGEPEVVANDAIKSEPAVENTGHTQESFA